jgi:hypothetical protein
VRRAVFVAVAAAAFVGTAGPAAACTSGITRSYFSYERPTLTGYSVGLLVSIPPGAEYGAEYSIRARLVGGVPGPSGGTYVRIQLPEPPVHTNCVYLGPTDGPVFVAGALQRNSRGELVLTAEARRETRPPSIFTRGRHDPSFYDRYIVDPAYLTSEERRRREAKPND